MTLPFKRKFKGCKRCGKPLIVPSWKNCQSCDGYKPKTKKKCLDCGVDITQTHGSRLRCKICRAEHKKEYLLTYAHRHKEGYVG